jgi:hypothetical protein
MFNHTVEHIMRRCIVNRLVELHPEDDEWAMGMARMAHSPSAGTERQGTPPYGGGGCASASCEMPFAANLRALDVNNHTATHLPVTQCGSR